MDRFSDMGIGVPSGLKASDKAVLITIANESLENTSIAKTDLAEVIGSPAVSTDTMTVLNGRIQTHKTILASVLNDAEINASIIRSDIITKLNAKGLTIPVGAAWATIQALIPNILQVTTEKKWATGVDLTSRASVSTLTISGLTFIPKTILLFNNGPYVSASFLAKNPTTLVDAWQNLYQNSNYGEKVTAEPTTMSFIVMNISSVTMTKLWWLAIA